MNHTRHNKGTHHELQDVVKGTGQCVLLSENPSCNQKLRSVFDICLEQANSLIYKYCCINSTYLYFVKF
jgi:hypothetical protein